MIRQDVDDNQNCDPDSSSRAKASTGNSLNPPAVVEVYDEKLLRENRTWETGIPQIFCSTKEEEKPYTKKQPGHSLDALSDFYNGERNRRVKLQRNEKIIGSKEVVQ